MALSTVDKFRKSREAEYCIKCFDKNLKFVNGSHLNKENNQAVKCIVTKDSKHRYSCLDKDCMNHMWICRKHKKLNEPTMKKQQARIKNSGATLNFIVDTINPTVESTAASVKSPEATVKLPVASVILPASPQSILPEYVPTSLPDSIRSTSTHAEIGEALHMMQASQISEKNLANSKASSTQQN